MEPKSFYPQDIQGNALPSATCYIHHVWHNNAGRWRTYDGGGNDELAHKLLALSRRIKTGARQ